MAILIYDLEVYSNLFTCAVKNITNDKKGIFKIGYVSPTLKFNDLHKLVEQIQNKKHWWVGWNSYHYDDQLLHYILHNYKTLSSLHAYQVAEYIKAQSTLIIEHNDNEYKYMNDFRRLDMMRMGRKGNIPKSLKLTAANLKHPLIEDLPIHHEKKIKPNDLDKLIEYNFNDVSITEKAFNYFKEEIKSRKEMSINYGTNIVNAAGESGVAMGLLIPMLAKQKQISEYEIRKINTINREIIDFSECIPDFIEFETPYLKNILSELKATKIQSKDKFRKELIIGKTVYDLAKGGLHSRDKAKIYRSGSDYDLVDADVSSFYPMAIINEDIEPEHMQGAFIKTYKPIVEERLRDKATGNKIGAKNKKIIVNSSYGQLGNPYGCLYDKKAMYTVTLTGQLSLLMLIEKLEQSGIEVFYANTDGITAKVYHSQKALYQQICDEWQKKTKFDLEFDNFKVCIIRNVNNYLMQFENGYIKAKGMMDRDSWSNLSDKKAFDFPIIAHALHEYFINGTPVRDTVMKHEDLYDFCQCIKVAKDKWKRVYIERLVNRRLVVEELTHVNRYFVTDDISVGGALFKEKSTKAREQMIAGEMVCLANDMNKVEHLKPKYSYYIKEARKVISEFETTLTLF